MRARNCLAEPMMRPFFCIGWPNRKMVSDSAASPRFSARRLSIGTNPAIALIKVDLPEPDAPISATISPRLSWNETFLRIGVRRSNDFETRRTSTRVSVSMSDLLADLGYQGHVTVG